jgi:hypothetical protein
MSPDAHIAR